MITDVTHVTILVADQEKAHEYYTETLGFETRDDETMDDGTRWVTVAPPGVEFPQLALVDADTEEQRERIGSQVADHANLVFQTEDCRATAETLRERGVTVHGDPETRPWGVEVTFEDLYGNVFDLLEPRPMDT